MYMICMHSYVSVMMKVKNARYNFLNANTTSWLACDASIYIYAWCVVARS